MARLPQPGGDAGSWGDVLNDYLLQTHASDGTLKSSSVGQDQLTSNAVTTTSIADSSISTAKLQDDSVTSAKLDALTRASITAGANAVQKGTLAFNVKDYGATGNGTTDDTAAIQTAINASSQGSRVYFPPGTYIVSDTINMKKSRYYFGADRELSTIKQANGANLDAVMASEGWLSSSATTSDNPIHISHLGINGNKANQTGGSGHGLAVITFWCQIEHLEIINTRGNGLHLTSARRDGVEISGTSVEAHIEHIDVRFADGYGIRVFDPTATIQSVTDGWLIDCIIQVALSDGIRVDCSAGWLVQGCHVYGARKNGIHMGRADSTRVIGNYIETWGASTTVDTYAAIAMGDGVSTYIGGANPSIVNANTMFYGSGAAGGTSIFGIRTRTSNGTASHLVITSNAMYSNGFFIGINVGNQGATATTVAKISGNLIRNWATSFSTTLAGGAVNITGDTFQTVTPSATTGFAHLPSAAGIPVGIPDDTSQGVPTIINTTNNQLYGYYGSQWTPLQEYGKALALTGATAATRYVGGTTSGSPSSGTFAIGDFVIDQTGKIWVCTIAGTPGTWVISGGVGLDAPTRVFMSQTPPSRPTSGEYLVSVNSGTSTSSSWTLGEVRFAPIDVPASTTFTGLATNVNVLGSGGTTPLIHLGVYADDSTGTRPTGSVLANTEVTLDPTTGGTGDRYTAWSGGSQTLSPGRYWLAWLITSNTAMGTQPTIVTISTISQMSLAVLGSNNHRTWAMFASAGAATLPTVSGLYHIGSPGIVGIKVQ